MLADDAVVAIDQCHCRVPSGKDERFVVCEQGKTMRLTKERIPIAEFCLGYCALCHKLGRLYEVPNTGQPVPGSASASEPMIGAYI